MMTFESQDFLREYPLVKMFGYGDDVLFYDAKAHLAFLMSPIEKNVLFDFLNNCPLAVINEKYGEQLSEHSYKHYLANFKA